MRPFHFALAWAVLLLGLPTSGEAQERNATYLQVATLTLKPGTAATWTRFQQRANEAAGRLGDQRTVVVLVPVTGGDPNRRRLVTAFEDFSEMDSWLGPREMVRQAFGDAEMERWTEELDGVITHVDLTVRLFQPDFTSGADVVQSGEYLQLVTTEVEPARNVDYQNLMRAFKAAEEPRGIYKARRSNAMGQSFVYTASWRFDDWSARVLPNPGVSLREEFGQEMAEAMVAQGNAAVRSRTFEIWRFRPELGRSPG